MVVPAGVTQIFVDAYGAEGATSGDSIAGGKGGRARALVAVTPGHTLTIVVGGAGAGGTGGFGGGGVAGFLGVAGGGGGYSGVFDGTTLDQAHALLVAGGGGGGGTGTGAGAGGSGGGAGGAGDNGSASGEGAAGGGGGTPSAPGFRRRRQ